MNIAIIPARGGSKGIPKKNLQLVNGKPLIAWSILQAKEASSIKSIFVSSDSDEILEVSEKYGAIGVKRPAEISGDLSSSEEAWIHSLSWIEEHKIFFNNLVLIQATSPIREGADFDLAAQYFNTNGYDSLFSATIKNSGFLWEKTEQGLKSLNYDYKNRKMRQCVSEQYIENGSFYIVKPDILKREKNRLGGKIGIYLMPHWKSYEIDELDDIKFCDLIMRNYLDRS